MFEKEAVIEEIKSFVIQNNMLYYLNKEEDLISENQVVHNVYGIESNKKALFLYQNMSDVETTVIFNNGKIENCHYALDSSSFNGINTILYNKDFDDIKRQIGLYNFETGEINWFDNIKRFGLNVRANNNLYYKQSHTTLKSLSLLTGEYEWETDLGGRKYLDFSEEKTAEIRHIVGVWENLLVVTMTHNEIIVVDIETGTVLWETHDLLKKQLQKDSSGKWRGYLQNCYLENGKLYELTSSIYYSIDLRTQKVEILWQDKREIDYVTVVHATYTSDNVYFTGSYNNRFQPHILGVFNRKTLQIEWVHDMNLSIDPKLGYVASLNQAPQVSEDKLYVLDSGGTLHIFEKEEVA